MVAAWAGALWWCQILAVGIGLVTYYEGGRFDLKLLGSMLGVAVVTTLQSSAFLHGLSSPSAGWPGPTRAARVLWAPIAVILAFAVVLICRSLLGSAVFSTGELARWTIISALIAPLLEHLRAAAIPVAIVGDRASAANLACDLVGHRGSDRIEVVAILDAGSERDMGRLADLAIQGTASVVILPSNSCERIVTFVCDRLSDTPAHVLLNVSDGAPHGSFRAFLRANMASTVFVDLLPRPIEGRQFALKRAFDLLIASLLLPVLAPLLVLVSVAIRLDTSGPILFRQWRFGQASRPIQVLKFRTMAIDKSDATGASRTVAGDPRVTRVGRILRKFSIDELPQLFNVLKGDMSLVGPRPHATHMKVEGAYYFDAIRLYRVRHRVLPGMTGWAQVNKSRGEVDTLTKARRRLELDLWYVAHWSLLLDMLIMMRTLTGGFLNRRGD